MQPISEVYGSKTQFSNSDKVKSGHHEVSLQYISGLQAIYKYYAVGEVLCAVMDLLLSPLKHCRLQQIIGKSVGFVDETVMKKAAAEATEGSYIDIKISSAFGGAWQKRGKESAGEI